MFFGGLTASAKNFYLSFDKAELEEWNWQFELDSIIDAREDKDLIGFIYKGFPKRKQVAYLQYPLHRSLKGVFKQAKKNQQGINEKLILRINHLYIYELKHPEKISAAEANVSFLKKVGNEYIEVFQASRYFQIEVLGAPYWHAQNIVDVLQSCFNDYEERKKSNQLKPLAGSINELNYNPIIANRPYPIEKVLKLKKGIYRSFYDLRENTIDTTLKFYPDYYEEKKGLRRAKLDFVDENVNPEEIYAFCDGRTIFIRGGKKFYEMVDSNGNYYLDRHALDYSDFSSGMITAGILFGPIGAAIYAASAIPSKSKYGYHLNLDLGTILPAEHHSLTKINAQVYIYNSSFNAVDAKVKLTIGDSLSCSISPNNYYLLEPPLKGTSIPVCVIFKEQKACLEIPSGSFYKDVYLIRISRKGTLKFDYVSTEKKQSILSAIRYGEARQACPPK